MTLTLYPLLSKCYKTNLLVMSKKIIWGKENSSWNCCYSSNPYRGLSIMSCMCLAAKCAYNSYWNRDLGSWSCSTGFCLKEILFTGSWEPRCCAQVATTAAWGWSQYRNTIKCNAADTRLTFSSYCAHLNKNYYSLKEKKWSLSLFEGL